MIDVQNLPDERGIKIRRTGITKLHLPLILADGGDVQTVAAECRFTVELAENLRGTHMSRLVEILNEKISSPLSLSDAENILREALEKLETDFAALDFAFKFFVKKTAPVSDYQSLLDVDCKFSGELQRGGRMKSALAVTVPFTSLCPCSREISDCGAHNQRSLCTAKLYFDAPENIDRTSIKEIVSRIESSGSSEIFPLLKREDEKFVTEKAYGNPKFVEDILRDVVLSLRRLKNVSGFDVECENFESIHNHNAFAAYSQR